MLHADRLTKTVGQGGRRAACWTASASRWRPERWGGPRSFGQRQVDPAAPPGRARLARRRRDHAGRVAGHRPQRRALARIRLRQVGFVFQQFHLIEELSGAESMLVPTALPGAPGGGARRAAELIDELGLGAVADHLPHELSGGEQQRFAFARALVNGPQLVLADEPTGSLDVENGAAVLEPLRGLSGRAVVIVTHEPEAAGIADRVLQLGDGKLEAGAMAS